jgi:hypothetical protein
MTWPDEQRMNGDTRPGKAYPARPGSASMQSDKPCGGKRTGSEGLRNGSGLENRLAGATP